MASRSNELQSLNSLSPSAPSFSPLPMTPPLEMSSLTDASMPVVARPFVLSELKAEAFVTLTVGEAQKPFIVLKSVLCLRSEYFRAMFDGNFAEKTSRTSSLPDVEPYIFGLILQWFYTGRVLFSSSADSLPFRPEAQIVLVEAIKMFIFADQYETRALRLAVFEIVTLILVRPYGLIKAGWRAAARALNDLPPSSGLHRLIADLFVYSWRPGHEEQADQPVKLLPEDVVGRMFCADTRAVGTRPMDTIAGQWPWNQDMCQYQEHMDDKERENCGDILSAKTRKQEAELEIMKSISRWKYEAFILI